MSESTKLKLSWFQVTLGILVVVALMIGSYFAGAATMMRQLQEAKEAELKAYDIAVKALEAESNIREEAERAELRAYVAELRAMQKRLRDATKGKDGKDE